MSDLYQTITLVLADGTRATYTGRPQMDATSRVAEIVISEPRPLPPGMTWDRLEDVKGSNDRV